MNWSRKNSVSLRFLNPFDVRKGEGRKTLLMFLYFFLTVTVLYVLKPVRSSLFLEELGSEKLRYVYLGEGFFLLFVTWAYVVLAKRVPRRMFFTGMLLVFISNLVLFWWLFHIQVRYLSALFYIWVACFSITSVTQFWTLANDIFDPQEAKRLFGLIISGGSAGGVLGGLLTNRAVRWMHTEDLLLLSGILLAFCVVLVGSLWKHLPAGSEGAVRERSPIEPDSTRKLFLTSPYLWMLAGVVLFAKVASTVVDNQFNAVVELHLVGKQARTAFFGAFSAILNVVSFLMQLCATGATLRLLGIGVSLTLLPAGLTVASVATVLMPFLSTATLLKIFDGSMNYSIQQTSKEVLYLPLASGVRYRAKPVIDMLIYRASKSLGGFLIILLAPVFAIPNDRIGVLVFVLVPFWLILVWKMRSAYLVLLRERLWKDEVKGVGREPRRASEVLSFLYDEKSLDQLRSFLHEKSTAARKMAATACLAYHRAGKDLQATRRLIQEMIQWEALETPAGTSGKNHEKGERQFLDELLLRQAEQSMGPQPTPPSVEVTGSVLDRLQSILEDPKRDMGLKKAAAEFLEHQATQEAADKILEILARTREHALRSLLIKSLIRTVHKNAAIRWNRSVVRKQVFEEAQLFEQIRRLYSFYQKSASRKEEFLTVALQALSDESLERLFLCLGLLYPGAAMRIIYERLVEHPGHDSIRSHAIELLQNLLGPEFYGLVERLFDERSHEEATEAEVVALLEEMLVSPDRWLSVIAYFLVAETDLAKRWPKLSSASSPRVLFESLDV